MGDTEGVKREVKGDQRVFQVGRCAVLIREPINATILRQSIIIFPICIATELLFKSAPPVSTPLATPCKSYFVLRCSFPLRGLPAFFSNSSTRARSSCGKLDAARDFFGKFSKRKCRGNQVERGGNVETVAGVLYIRANILRIASGIGAHP